LMMIHNYFLGIKFLSLAFCEYCLDSDHKSC